MRRMLALMALLTGSLAGGCKNWTLKSELAASIMTPLHANVTAQIGTYDNGPLREIVLPSGPHDSDCKVALVDVDGVLTNAPHVGFMSLGENPTGLLKEKLDLAANDPRVKAVVLRLNSPGGTTAATDLMAAELVDFRQRTGKPVVAAILDVGAGGAYYLACACDRVVVIPTGLVGGIGVIMNLYFGELASEQVNFFPMNVRSGESIDMGSPVRKMSPAEKKIFTDMAKDLHLRFVQAVKEGRQRVKIDEDVFDGRILSATQAKEAGLVDEIGHLGLAHQLACQLAEMRDAKTVMYRRPNDCARSAYDIIENRPLQGALFPYSVPGPDRSKQAVFQYLWQGDPTQLKQATGQ